MALIAPPETPPRARLAVRALALRGLVVDTVNPAVAADWGLDPAASGVVAVEVTDVAERLVGLQPGDLLLALNRQPLHNTADLDRVLQAPARYWELEILREGRRSLLRFRL